MDEIFEAEQAHLDETYAKLLRIKDELTQEIEVSHASARQDLIDMSEEIRPDYGGDDEAMETLAAIETLNAVIDAYNQHHDFTLEKLRDVLLLLRQPYFAKVRLKMRPGRPPRDVYIGTAGMTDESSMPFIVDWRSPVAETYYNQEMGPTSYSVDGKVRTVELLLRRQFDITLNKLNMYFDTTVAIEDSLLLGALKRHHTEKLQAITATIQREQNEVVRHEDVPVLLVSGIAGSGKTSVLLQRIAFLLYRERKSLDASQVYLFTPNSVFERYIDTVLPSLGESNPNTLTWDSFLRDLGLGNRGSGADGDPSRLRQLEEALPTLAIDPSDLREIRVGDRVLVKVSQIQGALTKFCKFSPGPRLVALVKDELHERLNRRISQLAKDEELQEEMLGLDVDQQVEVFGRTVSPEDEEETAELTREYLSQLYASAHDEIERVSWLRIDRLGMRMLGSDSLSAAEWVWCRLLVCGGGARDARYVMVDEVQDYTKTQLMVLARWFPRAHFLLLGDENQAIRENTVSWNDIREVFSATHGEVHECELLTSYRSSPEITELFSTLTSDRERMRLSSVRRPGTNPEILVVHGLDAYVDELRRIAREAAGTEGLTAFIAADKGMARWLSKQLGDLAVHVGPNDSLPAAGVAILDLSLAKGLEFDHVVVANAQPDCYPDTQLSRRRLYTAISRAMHKVTILAEDELTPLLASRVGVREANR